MCRRALWRGQRVRHLVLLVVGVAGAYITYDICATVRALRLGPSKEMVAIRDVGRVVSPRGEVLTFASSKGALLVPVPLYPSSQVQGATFPPTGFGDEVGLFLILGTSDSPAVVRDYYLQAWHKYGVTDRGAASRGAQADYFDLVTGPMNGRVASVEVSTGAAGPPNSVADRIRPASPGDCETKVIFFVPWVLIE